MPKLKELTKVQIREIYRSAAVRAESWDEWCGVMYTRVANPMWKVMLEQLSTKEYKEVERHLGGEPVNPSSEIFEILHEIENMVFPQNSR